MKESFNIEVEVDAQNEAVDTAIQASNLSGNPITTMQVLENGTVNLVTRAGTQQAFAAPYPVMGATQILPGQNSVNGSVIAAEGDLHILSERNGEREKTDIQFDVAGAQANMSATPPSKTKTVAAFNNDTVNEAQLTKQLEVLKDYMEITPEQANSISQRAGNIQAQRAPSPEQTVDSGRMAGQWQQKMASQGAQQNQAAAQYAGASR